MHRGILEGLSTGRIGRNPDLLVSAPPDLPAVAAESRHLSRGSHHECPLENVRYAELGTNVSARLDRHRIVLAGDDEPATARSAFARTEPREQRPSHIDEKRRVGIRVVYEPDQLGCSRSATLQEVDLNLISVNRVPEPCRCSSGREQLPDLLFQDDCRSRGQSYRGRDCHDYRPALRHRSFKGRSQAVDESKRDPIETQPGFGGLCAPPGRRSDQYREECDPRSRHCKIRVNRTPALVQRRGKAPRHGLSRRPLNLCRSAHAPRPNGRALEGTWSI